MRGVCRMAAGCYHRGMRGLIRIVLLAALLGGCGDYYDTDGIVLAPDCDDPQKVNTVRPRDGADDAYAAGWVVVGLQCPVETGVITLRTVTDEPVTGLLNLHQGGRQVRFRPSPPMEPGTTYDAYLDTSDGFREWRFHTSDLGRPTGATELAGRALSMHAARGTLLDPPGVDEQLMIELATLNTVVQLTSDATGATVNARLGGFVPTEEGDPQDPMQPVVDAIAGWDDPVVTFGPVDLIWRMDGWSMSLEQATWTVALAADLAGGGGGQLQARWDVREVAPVFGEDPCLTAAEFGTPCTACADGVPSCLPFLLAHTPANPWFGTLTAN